VWVYLDELVQEKGKTILDFTEARDIKYNMMLMQKTATRNA